MPGRKVGREWRISRAARDAWLDGQTIHCLDLDIADPAAPTDLDTFRPTIASHRTHRGRP